MLKVKLDNMIESVCRKNLQSRKIWIEKGEIISGIGGNTLVETSVKIRIFCQNLENTGLKKQKGFVYTFYKYP